jgi:hypothetical protein
VTTKGDDVRIVVDRTREAVQMCATEALGIAD